MSWKIGPLFLAFLFSTASGCAWTYSKPAGDKTWGFRYYAPKPLLLVTETSTRVVMVPNKDEAYAINYMAFLTKHDVTLKMEEGWWYKEVDDKSDPTEFLKGLIALGSKALDAAAAAARAMSEPVDGKLLGVYEFVFDGRGNISEMKRLGPGV